MIPTNIEQRLATLETVHNDPPLVHLRADAAGESVAYVWKTSDSCYEFMAHHVQPRARTLETGLGFSTVLFAAWGCQHTCVVPSQEEVDRCVAYLDEHGIDHASVGFHVAPSEDGLPTIEATPLDLVFIDGGHGWPTAIIDFFYAARRLVEGGWLILDDMQLPQVRLGLVDFLDRDPRWRRGERSEKWAAWQRLATGPLAEHESAQAFLGAPTRRDPWRRRLVPAPLRPLARRVRDVLR